MKTFEITRNFSYITEINVFDSDSNPVDLSQYQVFIDFYDSYGNLITSIGSLPVTVNKIYINIAPNITNLLNDGNYIVYYINGNDRVIITKGQVVLTQEPSSNIDYLIPYLRVKLGDIQNVRYEDSWLRTALLLAVRVSQRYLSNKYLIDENNNVYRNPDYPYFIQEYGIIEARDEPIIVLLAAIIVLEGSLENSAWDAVSWRDNEVAFSNLEQFRTRGEVLNKLVDELNSLLLPPVKRLAKPLKVGMPGYNYNPEEKKTRY